MTTTEDLLLSKTAKGKIFNYLQDIGCCCRCTLRFMGENDYKTFLFSDSVSEKFQYYCDEDPNEIVPPAKKLNNNPCICCLGALQFGVSESLIDQVLSGLKLSCHEFKEFVLRLTLPPTVELREHLLLNHLEEKFSDVYTSSFTNSVASVRDVFKWSYGPRIGRTFEATFHPFCDFAINISFTQSDFEKECQPLEQLVPDLFPNRNRKSKSIQERYSRSSILKALSQVSWGKIKEFYTVPPEVPNAGLQFQECTFKRDSVYLAGRYMKYSRNLSQTPWLIDGEKKFKGSVEEIIVDGVNKYVISDRIVFSSSGREDVDVRMLGKGRPFILEILDAHKSKFSKEECRTMQNAVNSGSSDVQIRDLQSISKNDIQNLKEGEENKKKLYSAVCCLAREPNDNDFETLCAITDLKVLQKTPIRVLHRRNLSVREKTIFHVKAEAIEGSKFKLEVLTQAGTYVKEFVHGDFGRTLPNIGSILSSEADIMELDVEEIEIDWPPQVD